MKPDCAKANYECPSRRRKVEVLEEGIEKEPCRQICELASRTLGLGYQPNRSDINANAHPDWRHSIHPIRAY